MTAANTDIPSRTRSLIFPRVVWSLILKSLMTLALLPAVHVQQQEAHPPE